MTIRPGGQALADGVFMRTPLAWAIAREDGSVEAGPMPRNRAAGVPVARVLGGLGPALAVAVRRGMLAGTPGRRLANKRFLLAAVAAEAGVVWLAGRVAALELAGPAGLASVVLPWVAMLAVLRWVGPGSLWRYHGAEHKAAAALEAGVDLDDIDGVLAQSRVHSRCGTNLAVPLVAVAWFLQSLPLVLQVAAFLAALAAVAEVVGLAARRPELPASRLLLAGGRALQRWVTTAEPTRAEQAVACRAMLACMAEHERVAAAVEVVPVPAAPVPGAPVPAAA